MQICVCKNSKCDQTCHVGARQNVRVPRTIARLLLTGWMARVPPGAEGNAHQPGGVSSAVLGPEGPVIAIQICQKVFLSNIFPLFCYEYISFSRIPSFFFVGGVGNPWKVNENEREACTEERASCQHSQRCRWAPLFSNSSFEMFWMSKHDLMPPSKIWYMLYFTYLCLLIRFDQQGKHTARKIHRQSNICYR